MRSDFDISKSNESASIIEKAVVVVIVVTLKILIQYKKYKSEKNETSFMVLRGAF